VAEEYCWAITYSVWLLCCTRTGSNVSEFGYKLYRTVATYIGDDRSAEFRLPHISTCDGPSGM